MAEDRPRFRRDLVAKPIEADGVEYVEVSDPRTGARFQFYDFEHRVAQALDGRRLDEVLPALRDGSGLELTVEQLTAFAQQLRELGFTEPTGDGPPELPDDLPELPELSDLRPGNGVPLDAMLGAVPAPGRSDLPTAELDELNEPESDQILREPIALPDFSSPSLPEFSSEPTVISAQRPLESHNGQTAAPAPAQAGGDRVITSELAAFRDALLGPEIDAAIEAATSSSEMKAFTGSVPAAPAEEVESDTLVGLAPTIDERATAAGELHTKPAPPPRPADPIDPLEAAITPLHLPPLFPPFSTVPPRPVAPPPVPADAPSRPVLVPVAPDAAAAEPAAPSRPSSPALFAALGLTVAAAIGFFAYRLSTTTDPAPIAVRTVLPALGSVYRFYDAVGTVKPSGERTLAFPTGGRVSQILAPGAAFKPGDVLGELDGARKFKNDLSHNRERLAYYEQMLESMKGAGNRSEARQAEIKIVEKKRLVSEAQARLSRVAITATGAGEIAETLVATGATAKPGAPAIRVKGTDWRAELELSREEADRLRHLGFCRAEIEGKPLDCSLSADGGDEIHVFIDLPADPAVVAGKPVRVAKARFDGVFVLPASALAPTKGSDRRVYVVKDAHVESYAVVLADQNESEIVVKQGLEPGNPVVVDVPPNLRPRSAVKVAK